MITTLCSHLNTINQKCNLKIIQRFSIQLQKSLGLAKVFHIRVATEITNIQKWNRKRTKQVLQDHMMHSNNQITAGGWAQEHKSCTNEKFTRI